MVYCIYQIVGIIRYLEIKHNGGKRMNADKGTEENRLLFEGFEEQKELDEIKMALSQFYPDGVVCALPTLHKDLYLKTLYAARKLQLTATKLIKELGFQYMMLTRASSTKRIRLRLEPYFVINRNISLEEIRECDKDLYYIMMMHRTLFGESEGVLLTNLRSKFVEKYIGDLEYFNATKEELLAEVQDLVNKNNLVNALDIKHMNKALYTALVKTYGVSLAGVSITNLLKDEGISFAELSLKEKERAYAITNFRVLSALNYYDLPVSEYLTMLNVHQSNYSRRRSKYNTIDTPDKAKAVLEKVASKEMTEQERLLVLNLIENYKHKYQDKRIYLSIAKAKQNNDSVVILVKIDNKVNLYTTFPDEIEQKLRSYGYYSYTRHIMNTVRQVYELREQYGCIYESPSKVAVRNISAAEARSLASKLYELDGDTYERLAQIGIYLDPFLVLNSNMHFSDKVIIEVVKQSGGKEIVLRRGNDTNLYIKLRRHAMYKKYKSVREYIEDLEIRNGITL